MKISNDNNELYDAIIQDDELERDSFAYVARNIIDDHDLLTQFARAAQHVRRLPRPGPRDVAGQQALTCFAAQAQGSEVVENVIEHIRSGKVVDWNNPVVQLIGAVLNEVATSSLLNAAVNNAATILWLESTLSIEEQVST